MVKIKSREVTAWTLGVAISLAIAWAGAAPCAAQTYPGDPSPPPPTMGQSISSGMSKIGDSLTPKPSVTPADDPLSLKSPGKPGVELYVAWAQWYEEKGKLVEAEGEYKKAMKESGADLRVLLAYARLKDRLGEHEESLKLYQKAAKAFPKTASVYNNLAIHYARLRMFREAVGNLEHAIKLQPKEVKYRNNLATVLVQTNMPQDGVRSASGGSRRGDRALQPRFLDGEESPAATGSAAISIGFACESLDGEGPAMDGSSPGPSAGDAAGRAGDACQPATRSAAELVARAAAHGDAQRTIPLAQPRRCRRQRQCQSLGRRLRCTIAPPPRARGDATPENPDATRRLPPVPDSPAATLDLPKFPSLPPEDHQQPVAPLPPEPTR